MFKIISTACLFSFSFAYGQSIKEINLKKQKAEDDEKYFDKNDHDFDITEVPEKWRSESAVILCDKISLSYFKEVQDYMEEETIRRRIKLQDRAAVEEFSKFQYVASAKIGLRIIKPSGEVKDVDFSGAIDAGKVPGFYRAFVLAERYKKIAIPGLEVGDIVDYYYSFHDWVNLARGAEYEYDQVIFSMCTRYSALKRIVFFNIEQGFFLNLNTYNTHVKPVLGEAGTNRRDKVKENIKTYVMDFSDLDKLPDERWMYAYTNYPTVKYQVVAGTKSVVNTAEAFLGRQNELKTTVSKKDISRVISRIVSERYINNLDAVSFVEKYLNKNFPDEKRPEKLMTEAWYALRFFYTYGWYTDYYGRLYYDRDRSYVNNEKIPEHLWFFKALWGVAQKFKIETEALVMVPRSRGTLDDVLTMDDIVLGVRINQHLILSPGRFYGLHTEPEPGVEGTRALAIRPSKDTGKISFSEITIPVSGQQTNQKIHVMDVDLEPEAELVTIGRSSTYTGQCKKDIPYETVFPYQVQINDCKTYDPNAKIVEMKAVTFEEDNEFKTKTSEALKAGLNIDVEDYHYSVKGLGRTLNDETFIFEERFTSRNLLNRTGKNFLLNLGMIFGTQTTLNPWEKERHTEIDPEYAKTIVTNINITIPDGYTVEGLDDLNVNIDNASMSFIAKAVLEGRAIKVTVKKEYKMSHDSKANWKNWTDALDAAFNYTQKKVVLKKA